MRRFWNVPRARPGPAAATAGVAAVASPFDPFPSPNDLNAALNGESPPVVCAAALDELEPRDALVVLLPPSESRRDCAAVVPGASWLPGVSAALPDRLTKISLRILATCVALPYLRR